MKNIILSTLFTIVVANVFAQDNSTQLKTPDQVLPRWCADFNFKYGALAQSYSALVLSSYQQLTTTNAYHVGSPKFSNGKSIGGDITGGYFFGDKRMFGVGLGLSYFSQTGNVNMDSFHVEYQSKDNVSLGNNIFRQIITNNPNNGIIPKANQNSIQENLTYTNISIPILFKFKHQFNRTIGITADLGPVVNIVMNNSSISTNAKFDYEAVYQGTPGHYVYDGATTPGKNDWLITKANYTKTDGSAAAAAADIAEFQTLGYNVGLQQTPTTTTANKNFASVNLGGIVQAGLTYQLNYHIAFVLGAYYSMLMLNNTGTGNWMLTDKVGQYSSMLNGVQNTTSSSYGLNVGIRWFIGGFPDKDGDGIEDSKDACPDKPGVAKFNGCPDTDNDGIPDQEDLCPLDAGPVCTGGCPDRDNDCVADKFDDCPDVYGPAKTHGCPDRDNDNVPDKEDQCPDDSGAVSNFGCPVAKLEEMALKILKADTNYNLNKNQDRKENGWMPPHIILSASTLYFDFNKAKLSKESDDKLSEAIDVMGKNPNVLLNISGYTDNIGGVATNILISYDRAEAVRKYLVSKGVDRKRIVISANGKDEPVNSNKTKEERALNRRIVMQLLLPISK